MKSEEHIKLEEYEPNCCRNAESGLGVLEVMVVMVNLAIVPTAVGLWPSMMEANKKCILNL
jgi:hypothetical protein